MESGIDGISEVVEQIAPLLAAGACIGIGAVFPQ